MIIEVLVAQRNPEEPLADQMLQAMFDEALIPSVHEAASQSADQAQPPFHLAQQQPAAVAAEKSARKISHHLAATKALKLKGALCTLCHSEVPRIG